MPVPLRINRPLFGNNEVSPKACTFGVTVQAVAFRVPAGEVTRVETQSRFTKKIRQRAYRIFQRPKLRLANRHQPQASVNDGKSINHFAGVASLSFLLCPPACAANGEHRTRGRGQNAGDVSGKGEKANVLAECQINLLNDVARFPIWSCPVTGVIAEREDYPIKQRSTFPNRARTVFGHFQIRRYPHLENSFPWNR